MMDWSKFNYGEYVMYVFIKCMVIWFGLLTFKFMASSGRDEKLNIFSIINSLFDLVIGSLMAPFLLAGIVVIKNSNVNVERILWIILIIFLIKKLYIKFIEWIRKILVSDKEKES